MTRSLLRYLAISGLFLCAFATPAHAQASYSSGVQVGGEMTSGQSRAWAWNVPRGNYVAIGSLSYRLRSDTAPAKLECLIRHGVSQEFWDFEQASISGDAQGGHTIEGEITLLSQIPMAENGQLSIECQSTGGQTQLIRDVRLELIAFRNTTTLTPVDPGNAGNVRDLRNRGITDRGRNN